jgi:hypothetical protein
VLSVPQIHSTQPATFRSFFTRLIMKTSYGLDISADSDDAYIVGIKDVAEGFFEASIPGRFLVDMIPALKYVPKWMPGTSWQRYADYHRKNIYEVKTEPFARVLEATVSTLSSHFNDYHSHLLKYHNADWDRVFDAERGTRGTMSTVHSH